MTEEIKVLVNPYNFNNKLITKNDIHNILQRFDIDNEINSLEHYQTAFVHNSYIKKSPSELGDNVVICDKPEGALELLDKDYETLEFLGDAVVSIIVAKYLKERFPEENEGYLTKMRTKLVNGEMLGYLASKINLGEFAIMSRHIEDKCKGRTSQHILEDIFEAFLGAMFLDFNEVDNYNLLDHFYSGIGFQICEKFMVHVIEEFVDFSELILKNNNYKEQLNKYFSETYDSPINFSEAEVEGGLNDRIYTVNILDDENKIIGTGIGKSKKKAEQYACKDCLIKLKLIKN